jgi:4,5-dihydroxyphthalate decarboxylase
VTGCSPTAARRSHIGAAAVVLRRRHPQVRRLFPDYRAAERDYYRRTGLFPIMHAVGIRRDVLEKNRWLAASVYKAFLRAKQISDTEFAETTALKIGLPWVNAEYEATMEVMGTEFWSYGVAANHKTLSTMARYSYEQGLAVRLLAVEEMFAEGNLGETRV